MSCKKKEQSSCTSTPRRVLESLSIKDISQARADCLANSLKSRKGSLSSRKGSGSPAVFGQYLSDRDDSNLVYRTSHWKNSVSPSVSGKYVCDRDDSYRKGSVSPSMSSQHLSVRDDCSLGIYRSSQHQWPGSSRTRPSSRKQSKTCSPLCAEVSAVIDGIENCRDAIGALAQDTQRIISAASGILDDCVCDNKSDQTKKKHKKVKKVDSCCRKNLGKKGSNRDTCCVPSWMNGCVCDEVETKNRQSNKVKATASKQSCLKICEEKSNHKVTASDCACNEKKKKQNKKIVAVDSKTCCQKKSCLKVTASDCTCKEKKKKQTKKIVAVDSKTCCQKKSSQDSCCVCIAPKGLDDCFCKDDMKKQQMKVKKKSSSCSCQKKIEKKTSDKNTCCLPPIVVDDCAFDKEMKKRNKKLKKTDSRNCGQKIFVKKSSGKNTCCVSPITADECACAADMKKRYKKVKKTDSQNCCQKMEKKGSDKDSCCIPPVIADDCACDAEMSQTCCQKMVRKKSSVKDTCCVPITPKDLDDCVCEGDKKKQNNVIRTQSKHSCQKEFEKKTSDKEASCVKPVVFDDWIGAENKKQSAKKDKLASAAMSCGIPSCAEKTCTCRFPPAYRQYFDCTGQISGSCQCDKNT